MTQVSNVRSIVNVAFKEAKQNPVTIPAEIFANYSAGLVQLKLDEQRKEIEKKAKKRDKQIEKLLKKASKAETKAEKAQAKAEAKVAKQEDLSTLSGNLNDLVSKVTKTGEVRFSELSEEERAKVVAAISQSLSAQGSSVQEPEPEMVERVEPVGVKPIEMTVSEGDDGVTDVEFTIGRAAASIPPEQDTPMGNALRNANRGNRQRGERQ